MSAAAEPIRASEEQSIEPQAWSRREAPCESATWRNPSPHKRNQTPGISQVFGGSQRRVADRNLFASGQRRRLRTTSLPDFFHAERICAHRDRRAGNSY